MKPGASVHRLGTGDKAGSSDWKGPLVRQEENSQFEGRRSFRKEAMVNTQSYREQETEVTTDWIVNMDTADRDENSLTAAQEPGDRRVKSRKDRGVSQPLKDLLLDAHVKGSRETGCSSGTRCHRVLRLAGLEISMN